MAHIPDAHAQAQFEYTRMQLQGSLNAVAETMRNCATIAEQFSGLIGVIQYHPAGLMLPNGALQQMPPPPPMMEAAGGKRKSRDEGDEKKKRKTKPKDPNAPKRPPSSYLLFQNEVRQELKAKHPNMPNNELLSMISKLWGEMPKERRDTYEDRQKAAKGKYLENKAAYENTRNADAIGADVVPAATTLPKLAEIPADPVVSDHLASSSSEEESSDDSGSDDSSEEEPEPPAKKNKQEAVVPTKVETKKEKKTKKAKA